MVTVLLSLSTKAFKHHNHNEFHIQMFIQMFIQTCDSLWLSCLDFPLCIPAVRVVLEVSTLRLSPYDLSLQKLVGGAQKGI